MLGVVDLHIARLYLGPEVRLVDLTISISSPCIHTGQQTMCSRVFPPFRTAELCSPWSVQLLFMGAQSNPEPQDLQKRPENTLRNGLHSHSWNVKQECGYRSAACKTLLDKHVPFPSGHRIHPVKQASWLFARVTVSQLLQGVLLLDVGFENALQPLWSFRCGRLFNHRLCTYDSFLSAAFRDFHRASSD